MKSSNKTKAIDAYIHNFSRRNEWFAKRQKVQLTSEQVEQMVKHAFCAGLEEGEDSLSVFDNLFGHLNK